MNAQMIIQLPMGISEDDLGVRHRLEDAVNQVLSKHGIGEVDGGDIGSGTMNVFALVDGRYWDKVLTLTVGLLQKFDVKAQAVIARRDITKDDDTPVIVWPEGSKDEFHYW